jgi:hypothetical protein
LTSKENIKGKIRIWDQRNLIDVPGRMKIYAEKKRRNVSLIRFV